MCSNCKECVYNRMCGSKEKYKQMIKEYNELNKKWDIFKSNPPCPEFKDIDKFAEENGYSKCTSKIVNTKDGGLSFEIKPIEEYKPTFKNSYVGGLEEKHNDIKEDCFLNIIFDNYGNSHWHFDKKGDKGSGQKTLVKEAKRVNEDLEKKCQKAYEKMLKDLLNS